MKTLLSKSTKLTDPDINDLEIVSITVNYLKLEDKDIVRTESRPLLNPDIPVDQIT